MEPDGKLVTRACEVCEWTGSRLAATDAPNRVVTCPLCHAPTRIVEEALVTPAARDKNPHPAALGRLGGLKGGKARAARLSVGRRRAIARKAAAARWRKRR